MTSPKTIRRPASGARLTPVLTMGIISPTTERARALSEAGIAANVPLRFRERVKARAGIADVLLFRIGDELFALDLVELEEALDLPELKPVPEMSAGMLGVFSLRGALLATYAPHVLLGIGSEPPTTALVLRGRDRRVALAVQDVEDVTTFALEEVLEPPAAEIDGMLLGVFHHGDRLVGLLDADTLIAACRMDGTLENS